MRWETKGPFLVSTEILGFLSIFQKSQASSAFEALNSTGLSRCQRDVRPPIHMRRGTRVSSMISTQDSDIPSSCDMKHEPKFKPLQGNPTLFLVRESRYPLHLKQKTQGHTHTLIDEGRLILRCLFKVGLLFNRILGISSLLKTICGAWSFLDFLW